jgi:hypothetical protein
MALTAVEVRSLKPRDRAYKVSDSGGLQVHVQPTGQRYWRYAFRWAGRQQTMALGVFPAVSLSEARAKRDAAKKVLASGTNPATVAREEKRAALLAEQVTFKVVAEEWVAKSAREGRAEVTLSKKRWMLAFAYPQLGSRPINRIGPSGASGCGQVCRWTWVSPWRCSDPMG